ncbi:MAG: CoA transferase [Myxococcota bacterium]
MRAWQTVRAGAPKEALALCADAPEPVPYPGTVLLEVHAAGLGLPDALMCQGSYAMTPKLPFTQGQEVVGRVIGWGDGVENRRVGDRVMAVTSFFTGHGSVAERCLALDDFCLPVPEGMTDAEGAAFLIPYHTAFIGLVTRGKLEPGETLLVLGGAGGTGSAAIEVGRALGARVIATVGGPEKIEHCRALGADLVIDRRAQDIAESVLAATDGRGADCVYDPVGGEAFQRATRCVAHEGRILAIGFASGSWGRGRDRASRQSQLLGRRRDPERLRPGLQGGGPGAAARLVARGQAPSAHRGDGPLRVAPGCPRATRGRTRAGQARAARASRRDGAHRRHASRAGGFGVSDARPTRSGPLAGLRVLDLTSVVSGPMCTQALGDLGADVLKLEAPGGDQTRYSGAPFREPLYSAMHTQMNRNKRSLVVDLKHPAGRDLVLELIPRIDVLVENFRPDVMGRLGLGYEVLAARNPGLVYASINGFGSDGPYAALPAYDQLVQGLVGVMPAQGGGVRRSP